MGSVLVQVQQSPCLTLYPPCLHMTRTRAAYHVTEHPDMPHGIFARMHQRLSDGLGAAGYYLCRDIAGKSVWISYNVYPNSEGFVACHFQAKTASLASLHAFFKHLRTVERAVPGPDNREAQALEVQAAQLLEVLKQEGLTDYRALALRVTMAELAERWAGRERAQITDLYALNAILDRLTVIDALGAKVSAVSERSKLIPYQLKLQAARLESGKGPISVIATNHQELTTSMLQITRDIHEASSDEIHKVTDAIAYLSQSNQAAEILDGFAAARSDTDMTDHIAALLGEVIEDCSRQVEAVTATIDTSAAALIVISKRMRRALSAMEMTRLMCKVERANINGPTEGLENIVDHLREVESILSDVMGEIDDVAKSILVLLKKRQRATV